MSDKFKVGDKVKIVKGGSGIHHRHVGETTVITSEGFESPFGDGTRYYFDATDFSHGGKGATEDSFELVEAAAKPEPKLVVISYNGIDVTFDAAFSAGEALVKALIEAIYEDAANG